MAAETFACPECQASLRYSPNLKPGDEVQCPKCRTQFPVPDPATQPAGPTEEYTDRPGAARPRFSAPADEDISATRRPAGYGGREGDGADEDYPPPPMSGNYSIDINRWFAAAGQHYGAILGPAIGFLFVAGILTLIMYVAVGGVAGMLAFQAAASDPAIMFAVLTVVLDAAMLILGSAVIYPLFNGFYAVCLAQVKGRTWSFGDFFSGFRHFAPLATVGFLSLLLGIIVALPSEVVEFVAIKNNDLSLRLMSQGVNLAGLVVSLFFQIRLFQFAPIMIFDRKLPAMDALKANWELTRGHFWGLFGVNFLLGLIAIGGFLACGIGLLFAVPYVILIQTAGYVLITDPRGEDDYRARYND